MSALVPRSRRVPKTLPPVAAGAFYLGTEVPTGAPYFLAPDAITRGVHLRGGIGCGKTSVLRQILVQRGVAAPWVHYDYIGVGHRELEAWIAYTATAIAIAEAHSPVLEGTTAAFLRRFAFLTVGGPDPAVRFDLLRRRRLPDGSLERIRDVVSRALEILFVKLNDADAGMRVRFDRIVTAVLTALVAANRPITECFDALYNDEYPSFLDRELEAHPVPECEREYVLHQLRELDQVYARRPADPRKKRFMFEDETGSTHNSLADFGPGKVLGDIFGAESFPLEDVAYGNACLSITNREAHDLTKVKAYQAVHAMLHALCLHRVDIPGIPGLFSIVDELWWMRRNVPGILAVSRNLGVSYALLHQDNSQFEDIGLRTLAKQLPALTNLQIRFRPPTIDEAEEEVLHTHEIQPDGLVQRFWASGSSNTDTDSSTISKSWANALRYSEYGEFAGSGATKGGADAWGTSSASGTSDREVLNVVGFGDQVKLLSQAALRRPRFRGVVTAEGWGTEVDFAEGPLFPHILFGVPILDIFHSALDASLRARTIHHTPFAPSFSLSWSALRAPAPARAADVPPSSARGEGAPADRLASQTIPPASQPRGPIAAANSDPSARAPVPPPAFPGLPARAAQPRRRRRRRRGNGGPAGAS